MTRQRGTRTVVYAAAAFAVLSVTAALVSDGFLDADAATHYLFARYAIHNPFYLVNVWGRPLATAAYMPGVFIAGRLGARVVSLLCALTCALTAWRLAILQRYRLPALAAIFTLGQPLFFLHSFSEMTELPFAALLGLAFLAYRTRRFGLMALAASLLPLGRPEGFAFCLLAALALIAHRRYAWLIVTPLATIAWCYAGWVIEERHGDWWMWLVHAWPYGSQSDYARGPLLHFVYLLPMLLSPVAMPAVVVGMWRSLGRFPSCSHVRRCQWLIGAIPLTVLVFHSLFHWLGRFSSNGELRYLLIVAPMWGLLAAHGWQWAWDRLRWQNAPAWAALAVITPGLLNFFVCVIPLRLDDRWQSAAQLVNWYENSALRQQYPYLLFADPAVDYFLDKPADDPVRKTPWNRELVADKPSGTLLIWDEGFSDKNANADRDVSVPDVLAAGWISIPSPPGVSANWQLFKSPWTIQQATPAAAR